jgi:cell division septation protein DedD
MTFKDDVRNKTGAFLTKSQQIFEKIFAQATREFTIRRKPKPATPKPATVPAPGTPRTTGEKPKDAKRPEKSAVTYKTSEKVKATPASKPKPKPRSRAGAGSRVLRASLLLVLLLVLAGFFANYFAVIDLTVIPDFLGLGPKHVVHAPITRKQPVKPPEKPVTSPKPSQPLEKVPPPPPAPSEPTPPSVSKEEKLIELETPTTLAQSKPGKGQVEEKASSPSTLTSDQPKPPDTAPTQQPKPVPAQTQASAKPAAQEVAPPPPITAQYPYSVYLGSFKAPEAVKRALSDYQEKGLSAYWARADLGEKGVWFRFFTGYFRTKEETEEFIRDRNIQGATPGITKYANFIGSYGSDKEVEDQKRALVSAGFYPYVIKGADGRSFVYSGAFDRKDYAEKERALLASKGIRSEVVER